MTVEKQSVRVHTDLSPIFVVGTPRSGTTLLQLMLNAHSQLSIMGELHYFDEILQIREHIPNLDSNKDFQNFFKLLPKAHSLQYLPKLHELLATVKLRMENTGQASYEIFHRYMMEGKRPN